MTFSLTKPSGFQDGYTIYGSELTDLDEKTAGAVDKTGDTVTGAIVFGSGSRLNMASGSELQLNNGGDWYVEGGGRMFVQDSGTLTVQDNGTVVCEAGSMTQFESGSSLSVEGEAVVTSTGSFTVQSGGELSVASGGTFTVAGTFTLNADAWPQLSSRTITLRDAPKLVGQSASDVCEPGFDSSSDVPCLRTAYQTTSTGKFWIEIPRGPYNSTLTSVILLTKGLDGTGSGVWNKPTYQLKFMSSTDGTLTDVGSLTDDAHTSSNWETDWVETTITVSSAYTANGAYVVYVNSAYNSTESTRTMIAMVSATYTVTELRY